MLPDKKSTSFTWLQGTKKSEGDRQEKLNLKEEEMDMDVDMSIPQTPHTVSKVTITDYSDAWKENKLNHHNQQQKQQQQQQKRKRMTRMGASSLIRRTSASGKQYFSMEQDLPEEDEESLFADEDTSGNSKDSSSSLTQKLNKTIKDVKTSIGNLSQKFRRSTRRRYAVGLGESSSMVDISPTRRILGRTPTKLYSPFGFDSPFGNSPLSRPPMRRLEHPTTPQMMRRTSLAVASRIQRGSPQTRMGLRDLKNSPIINRQSFRF